MIVKVPVYVEIEGAVHDPPLVIEFLQLVVQNKILSGKPEKKLVLVPREWKAFKGLVENKNCFTLISRNKAIDNFR